MLHFAGTAAVLVVFDEAAEEVDELVESTAGEERGKVSCTMDDSGHLDWGRFPTVDHHVRVEIPEAIFSAEQFVMEMADTGRAA